jgi:hypothetical protein
MTWRFKVQGVVVGLFVVGGMAVASGAGWTDLWALLSSLGW